MDVFRKKEAEAPHMNPQKTDFNIPSSLYSKKRPFANDSGGRMGRHLFCNETLRLG